MDPKDAKLVKQWKATWTPKEKELYAMAEQMLKKTIGVDTENDNGSYYAEKCHGFKAWLKTQAQTK